MRILLLPSRVTYFLNVFYWLCYYSCPISPLYSPPPCTPLPTHITPISSCPRVIHRRSLASLFPILFLTSPFHLSLSIFYLQLCFFFPVPFLPLSASQSLADNPPCHLHFCDSVPFLVVCLVCFCFFFSGSVVDSYEFVVILLFIFLIIFFFLDRSL